MVKNRSGSTGFKFGLDLSSLDYLPKRGKKKKAKILKRVHELVSVTDARVFDFLLERLLAELRDDAEIDAANYIATQWKTRAWSRCGITDGDGHVMRGAPGYTNSHEVIHKAIKEQQNRRRVTTSEAIDVIVRFIQNRGPVDVNKGFTISPNGLGRGDYGVLPSRHRESFIRAQDVSGITALDSDLRIENSIPWRTSFRFGSNKYIISDYAVNYLNKLLDENILQPEDKELTLQSWFEKYVDMVYRDGLGGIGLSTFDEVIEYYSSFYRFDYRPAVPRSLLSESWRLECVLDERSDFARVRCWCPVGASRLLCKHSLAIGFAAGIPIPASRNATTLTIPRRGNQRLITRALVREEQINPDHQLSFEEGESKDDEGDSIFFPEHDSSRSEEAESKEIEITSVSLSEGGQQNPPFRIGDSSDSLDLPILHQQH